MLLGDPTVGLDGGPVLRGEVVALVVNDVIVHQLVELVEVEERDHGVAVVLGMEVGVLCVMRVNKRPEEKKSAVVVVVVAVGGGSDLTTNVPKAACG